MHGLGPRYGRTAVHPDQNASSAESRWPALAAEIVRQLSRKSELTQVFRYMGARLTALVRCFSEKEVDKSGIK